MKKLFILAAMMTATVAANAQYTPEAGKISTEVNFNPFTQDKPDFQAAGVKVRYFFADNQALRVNLNFGLDKTTSGEKSDTSAKNTNTDTKFGIGLGYEYHFAQTDRISVYAGGQVGFEMLNKKAKSETNSTSVNLKQAGGYTQFSVAAVSGVDVYLWKGLFVGAELGLQFKNKSPKDYETLDGEGKTVTVKASGSTTNIGFYVEPALRLGWTF